MAQLVIITKATCHACQLLKNINQPGGKSLLSQIETEARTRGMQVVEMSDFEVATTPLAPHVMYYPSFFIWMAGVYYPYNINRGIQLQCIRDWMDEVVSHRT